MRVLDQERRSRTYTVCLTRFDGKRLYVVCRIGQKLRMQSHHEGTYLISSFGVTLVSESRATINERIVQGLGALVRPPDSSS